ncbi:alpha/beta fold hydrolase [Salinibaculum salinum]|uniref:alpha/beta hydrolase n=1 Tax=Salinibaculum salinum TaxID=3131996 RepID=UPI0030ED7201
MDTPRRRFLQSVATLTAGGLLAGCQSGEGDVTTTETPNGTATPTEPPTDESDGDQSTDAEALKQRAQEYVRLLDDGKFEAAHDEFTEQTAAAITVDQLERAWNGTAGQKGSLQEITETEHRGTGDAGEVVVVRARFENGTQQFNFVFTTEGITGFRIVPAETVEWTPPTYVDQSAFTERELTLSAPGDCSLGATLTVPENGQSVPGVVLVHGNGAQDRDETIGPNKTFKDIAWGLASRGIAVLRYDKRTYACDVDRADATIDDIVTDDALTALDRLRSVEGVDSVFVAGHSFGGLLAPRIAKRDGNLAGVVMLAPGPARPMADAIVAQTEHLANVDGTVTDAEQQQLEQVREMAEKIRTLDIDDDEIVNNYGGDEYYRTLREYDHTATVQDLSIPRYVAQGGSDWQVTVEEDLDRWRTALERESTATIEVYPDLNHHFQESTGKETAQEYQEPDSHVAERLVADIVSFVTTHG